MDQQIRAEMRAQRRMVMVCTCYHEAAHALVAVHFHVPFDYVEIANDFKSGRKLKKLGEVRLREWPPLRVLRDLEAKRRDGAERHILVLAAGRPGSKWAKGAGCDYDDKMIKEWQKEFRISDARVAQLRSRVSKLLERPFMRDAIATLSGELLMRKRVSPAAVRKIYKEARRFEKLFSAHRK